MRKVNSKATLHPNNSGNGSSIGMSPATAKPHSMMKLYKVQTGCNNIPTSGKINVNIQPSTIIAKTIQARRMQICNTNQPTLQNRTNNNITMLFGQEQNNNSVQTVKPSTVFSPGDTIQRKNNDLSIATSSAIQKANYSQWEKQSPLLKQKLFTNSEYNSIGSTSNLGNKTNELYNNMRKQLEKQRSLQTLFNTTQKLSAQNTYRPQQQQTSQQMQILNQVALQAKTSRNNIQQSNTLDSNSQRAVIRRGSKYQANLTSNGFLNSNSGILIGHHSQQNSMINNSNCLNNSQRSANSNNQISQISATVGTSANPQGQSGNSHMFMFKNNLSSLTRNKSAFINFNSTQPVQQHLQQQQNNSGIAIINKTQIDLRVEEKSQFNNKIMINRESPSVSSDEEKRGNKNIIDNNRLKDFHSNVEKQTSIKLEVLRAKQNLGSHQKKRSQLPHGSFIETKMKNCLHSRNADPTSSAYQTYQGAGQNQKVLLSKNQSQPSLYPHQKNMNLTQRTTFVKTSFLRHDDSRSVTPINQTQSKSPNGHSMHDDKVSTKSKTRPIQGLKGDMKSLNLSPIVPQNLGKNQAQFQRDNSHNDNYRTNNISSASKRLELRKQSVNSNSNQNNSKPFSSLKKERSAIEINKQTSLRDEPTTEKKTDKKDKMNLNAMKYQKPGYSSQETERGPGGTNSYSTADDINLISNESHQNYVLRFKNEGSQSRKMFQNDKSKQYQGHFTDAIAIQEESVQLFKKPPTYNQPNLFDKTQESKIKVTQILNNNNLSQNSNRYNLNITPEQIFIPDHLFKTNTNNNVTATKPAVPSNKTPRALPYLNDETLNYENKQIGLLRVNKNGIVTQTNIQDVDEQLTQKKKQKYIEESKSDSSFDDDEDMVDAKDFEEFDRAERSQESQNSMKVRVQIIEQDSLFRDLKVQPNLAAGDDNTGTNNVFTHYNQAAQNLNQTNNNFYFNNPKDDRNSLVNYDTSLLTHNTGRDNNSSPISELRDTRGNSKRQIQQQQIGDNNKNQQANLFQNHQPQQFTQQNRVHTQPIQNNHFYKQSDISGLFIDNNSFILPGGTMNNQNDQTVEMINTRNLLDKYDLGQDQNEEDSYLHRNKKTKQQKGNINKNKEQCDDNIFEVYKEEQKTEDMAVLYKQILQKLQKEEENEIEKITQQTLASQKYRSIRNDKEKAKYLSTQITSIRNKYKQMLIEKVLNHQQ